MGEMVISSRCCAIAIAPLASPPLPSGRSAPQKNQAIRHVAAREETAAPTSAGNVSMACRIAVRAAAWPLSVAAIRARTSVRASSASEGPVAAATILRSKFSMNFLRRQHLLEALHHETDLVLEADNRGLYPSCGIVAPVAPKPNSGPFPNRPTHGCLGLL